MKKFDNEETVIAKMKELGLEKIYAIEGNELVPTQLVDEIHPGDLYEGPVLHALELTKGSERLYITNSYVLDSQKQFEKGQELKEDSEDYNYRVDTKEVFDSMDLFFFTTDQTEAFTQAENSLSKN